MRGRIRSRTERPATVAAKTDANRSGDRRRSHRPVAPIRIKRKIAVSGGLQITRRAPIYTVAASSVAMKAVIAGTSITVVIEDFAFVPAQLSVKAGTKVIFVNHDDVPLSVIGLKSEFRSNALNKGESFAITFDKPGEIDYFCGLHGNMRGKITVVH